MVMVEEAQAPSRSVSWKPVAVAVVATLVVVAGAWWVLVGSKPNTPSMYSSAWLGTVTSAPLASNGNTMCVKALPGEPSGVTDGEPWCGVAYPSRGLEIGDLTVGTSVRVVTFITTAKDGEDVSGMLVLPANLPNPPSA